MERGRSLLCSQLSIEPAGDRDGGREGTHVMPPSRGNEESVASVHLDIEALDSFQSLRIQLTRIRENALLQCADCVRVLRRDETNELRTKHLKKQILPRIGVQWRHRIRQPHPEVHVNVLNLNIFENIF
ncbi:hypothetical protein PMAYCL1PPCAC_01335 [Pristionchus mayeri]|uniref:Uncharacterized protein n=1 Tax=Pristionchus mayeri TaxID=1317129 RepID=A0AAN4Z5N3_9BILA|nr:hypothetical protein PMAYCL1PPCAC_01335 [Pristionchus mayeri]